MNSIQLKIDDSAFLKKYIRTPVDILAKELGVSISLCKAHFYSLTAKDPELFKLRSLNVNVQKSFKMKKTKLGKGTHKNEKDIRLFYQILKDSISQGLKFPIQGRQVEAINAVRFAHEAYKREGGTRSEVYSLYVAIRVFCVHKKLCGEKSMPSGWFNCYNLLSKYFEAKVTKSEIPGLIKVEKPEELNADSDNLFVKANVTLEGGNKTIAYIPAKEYITQLMKDPRGSIISLLKKQGELVEM